MGDDRLRTLERRWQETGAVEDETAYFPMSAYRLGLILGKEPAFEIMSKALIGYALRDEPASQPPASGSTG